MLKEKVNQNEARMKPLAAPEDIFKETDKLWMKIQTLMELKEGIKEVRALKEYVKPEIDSFRERLGKSDGLIHNMQKIIR